LTEKLTLFTAGMTMNFFVIPFNSSMFPFINNYTFAKLFSQKKLPSILVKMAAEREANVSERGKLSDS
jgi:hypothetical protein